MLISPVFHVTLGFPGAEFNPVFVVLQVDCMEEALQRSQGGDLKVSVLLDYSRGSRGSSLPPAAPAACRLRGLLTPTHPTVVPLLRRTGQLQDDAAAAAAPLHLADARLPVPHAGPAGAAAPARPAALQRDHRRPAHQGLPVRRQRHHQRVRLCFSKLLTRFQLLLLFLFYF